MLDRLIHAFLVVGSVSVACSWTWPILDARLGDGSRLAICVRRFGTPSFSVAQLVSQGALPAHIRDEAERVLHTCRNILLSGGTASGNTTLLNALIALIPDDQRIVAIEDTLELRIDSPNCVRFEARRLQQGAVTIRNLVRHALRHRPDHIVVGEVRGAESGRPVASPQHRTQRLAHHRPCEQCRQRPVPLGELRDAGRRRAPVGRDLPGRGGRHRHRDPHDAPRGAAIRGRSRRGTRLRRREHYMGHPPTRPRDGPRPSRTHRRILAVLAVLAARRIGGAAAGGDARVRPYTTNQGSAQESCEFIR